ncbi:amidase signature enzyme [Diplogelasinospora grovesii]|uniref:Amidase signature enzyme n=1 Tax=Diplogelasinospora grovesii TaxID=303347 RepID=A0AAN6MWP9_9PEZI|nr:amidase signature enzyme [Diplogelasinospora grovesii]
MVRPRSFRSLHSLALAILAAASSSSAQLVSTGLSVTFNDVYYFISPYSSGKLAVLPKTLSSLPSVYGFKPVTVVGGAFARSDLPELVANWTAMDDVFQPAFLQAVFLSGSDDSCVGHTAIANGVSSLVLPINDTTIPSGPHFLETATGSLYPVYRLYEDFAGAFTESLLQTPEGKFQPLSAQVPGSASLTIGVPSRLYYTKTAEKPLAGVRIGVKDIFALAGVKQSNGNRAWYNLYPANNVTAPSMQRLIDAGAQIIGLQKPSQFANGETATADWVDYHSPFNPRGDGYQDASSSSSGAGASAASYEWLDIAVGSDTGGSIRGPSGVHVFSATVHHVMPLSTNLDTAGFLLRDPFLWDVANTVLYKENYTSLATVEPKYPKTVYTIGFPTHASSSAANALLLDFLDSLTTFIGGAAKPFNITSEWASSRPAEVGDLTIPQLLNTTYPALITKEQTALLRDPFFRDYAAAHDGRTPFVDPAPLARWAYGDSLPASALQEAIRNKTVFMDWWNARIMPPVADPAQCSSSLMLYVGSAGAGAGSTRNRYLSPPQVPFGWSTGRISVYSGCPDHVYPIGQVAAKSDVTNHEELFPVAVDIMAAKGCDGLLVRLAQDLIDAGILAVPKTGGSTTGGDILK